MPGGVKGMLLGLFFAFVLWCIQEAVVEYRFWRKMKKTDAQWIRMMRWPRHRRVRPLFWEQGEDDV